MECYFIVIIVIVILTVIVIGFYWLYKVNFTLSPTGSITENIICIKNGISNVFIYTKGPDRVVIDAGFSLKGMKKELMKVDIIPDVVTDVFVTHTDPDHTAGLSIFRKANIYFGKDSKVKNSEDYNFLEDNAQILVGTIKIQAISTPGHRRGHTSYLIDDGYLFSGDLVRLKANRVKPFFKFISSDHNQLLNSIRKIAKLDNIKMLLTSHSGYSTEFEKAIKKWKTLVPQNM